MVRQRNLYDILDDHEVDLKQIKATLTRAKTGTFRGSGLFDDGTVGAPSIAFTADTDSGIYRVGADVMGFASNGLLQFTTGSGVTGGIRVSDGSQSAPGISFIDDTDTGIWRTTNQMNFIINGANNVRIGDGYLIVSDDALDDADPRLNKAGTAASPAYMFRGDTNTGMYSRGADNLGFATGGVAQMYLSAFGILADGAQTTGGMFIRVNGAGAVATPTYSFFGDSNTGMYSGGADILAFATGGTNRWSMNSSGTFYGSGIILTGDGTALQPAYNFLGDQDTGMYRVSSNRIGFSGGNTTQFTTGNSSTPGIRIADGTETYPGLMFFNDSSVGLYRPTTDVLGFVTSSNERGRITSGGQFLWFKTASGYANVGFELASSGQVYNTQTSTSDMAIWRHNSLVTGVRFFSFRNGATIIGSITANGTSNVAYNTSSDIRRKKFVKPIRDALDTLMQLEPIGYEMKKGDGTKYQGFSAQHTVNLVPSAVTYSEDDDWWGMDLGQLVPTLVAAVQELTERVAILEGS